ncbi:glycosyltransferase family 2 protein [Thermodesulfobacteriota bacterium B35]
MMVADIFLVTLGVVVLLVMVYLAFLAVASFWPAGKRQPCPPCSRFAILIPAHNEEGQIGATLDCLLAVDYPAELYEIIVVADSCTDRTVEEVRSRGVACWQYENSERRGKGFVLQWAFPRLLARGDHDVFVVLDADSHVEAGFLKAVNNRFCQGALVVQGYSQVRHPERSVLESLAFLGFALNRNLRYRGRSRLGLSANLMGTGMCFSRQIIERFGWPATSMVEDVEYQMFLLLHGIRVVFASDARISVELHSCRKASARQRARWDMGKVNIRNRFLGRLLRRGLGRGDIRCLDGAMELLLPPFAILFLLIVIGFALFSCRWCACHPCLRYMWLASILLLVTYTGVGLVSARAGTRVYRALLSAPLFIFWRLKVVLEEIWRGRPGSRW